MTLSIGSSLLALVLAVPCAHFVSRGKGRFPYNLYSLSLAMWLVPPIAFSLQIYFWFTKIGFYDNLLSLILLHGVLHSTLGILLLTPFLDKISKHIDEAAFIDGLKDFGVLYHVHCPLILPAIGGVAALCFVRSWNELLFGVLLTDTNVQTLSVTMLGMTTGSHIEWGQIAATGTLAILPAVLALIIFWISGLIGRPTDRRIFGKAR